MVRAALSRVLRGWQGLLKRLEKGSSGDSLHAIKTLLYGESARWKAQAEPVVPPVGFWLARVDRYQIRRVRLPSCDGQLEFGVRDRSGATR